MILHLFSFDENEKFSLHFIDYIKSNYNLANHKFLIIKGKGYNFHNLKNNNIDFLEYKLNSIIKLNKLFRTSSKVILHGFGENKFIEIAMLLNLNKIYKFFWVIWGGDLYLYKNRFLSLRNFFKHYFRKIILYKVKYVVTFLIDDFKNAKIYYTPNAKMLNCLCYLSNTTHLIPANIKNSNRGKNDEITFLVGNSAKETNNHLEVFQIIKNLNLSTKKVICPLSYPIDVNTVYKNNVLNMGKNYFGFNFFPLIDFMNFRNYINLLMDVDVVIYNHKIQQAMGNTIMLLSLGKTVFMRSDTPQWNFLSSLNLKIFDIQKDLTLDFFKLNETYIPNNIEICNSIFSLFNLKNQWDLIFNLEI